MVRVLGVSEFSPAEAKCGGAVRVSWLTSMRGACAAVRRLPDSSVAELPGGTSLRWSTPAPTANDLRQELELTRFQVDRGSYAVSSAQLAGGQHGSSGRRLSSDSSSAFGRELVEFVSNACKITTSHSAT